MWCALALLIGTSQAQTTQTKVEVKKPVINSLGSPDFPNVSGARKRFKSKDWLEIEVEIKVDKKLKKGDIPFIEELGVDWYIAIDDPKSPGKKLLLSKQIDYINVPLKEKVMVSAYLSPTSLKLLTGKDRVVPSEISAAAAVISIDGEEVEVANNFKPKWWESESLSQDTSVPLLSKDETPFRFHWWDLYAEAKPN